LKEAPPGKRLIINFKVIHKLNSIIPKNSTQEKISQQKIIINSIRQLIATIKNYWQQIFITGNYFLLLAIFGNRWQFLATGGNILKIFL